MNFKDPLKTEKITLKICNNFKKNRKRDTQKRTKLCEKVNLLST